MITVSLQEKNGIYQAVLNYRDNNGKRKQKWISTKLVVKGNKRLALAKCEEIKLDFEKELSLTNKNERKEIIFLDFIRNWLKLIKNTIALNTYGSYNQMIEARINTYFSNHKIYLSNLEPIHIQDFYNTMLLDELSANTIIHYHAVIRKSLDYAYKMNMISSNPADKIQKPKKEQFIGGFYSKNELEVLFEKTRNNILELPIILASFYGLRRSEVLGLKWSAFDFNNKTITINHTLVQIALKGERKIVAKDRTKNKSSYRTLPLVPDIEKLLLEHKTSQEKNKSLYGKGYNDKYLDYVCVNELGDIIKPDYVTKQFTKFLKKHKLKEIRFHDLRHSCASLLLSKGISLKEIQEWLGHSNFSATANIYAHLNTTAKLNSASVLASAFSLS